MEFGVNKILAVVFPGQGSQTVGMLNNMQATHPAIVAQACAEASAVLGYDIADLIAHDKLQQLNQTEYTQPAMLVAGVIAWRIREATRAEEGTPAPVRWLAGHSLGEYTALVCANALTLAEGVKLVAKRAQLMQQAVAPGVGAMAAILGLDLAQVQAVCANITAANGVDGTVQAANINAPGQTVIAGTATAVAEAIKAATAAGAKRAILLPVSVPAHCTLMQPAADEFINHLQAINWQQPQIPVIHNYDVTSHNDAASICSSLVKQLYHPVRWVDTIEYFVQQGVNTIVECGPGQILTGLLKRIAPQLRQEQGAVVC